MKKTLIAVALTALTLCAAGCAKQVQEAKNAWSAVTGSTVSPTAVIVSAESFDALESLATVYVGLPRCTGTNGPACSYYAAVKEIRTATYSGRDARNALKQFLRSHPGQLGPTGLYDAVNSTTAALESIVDRYNVRSAVQ